MHSEGYLLISNAVYTNQIGFCFQQLSLEENQFEDATGAILHGEDPLQTHQCMLWQHTAAETAQAMPLINTWFLSKSRFHVQGTGLSTATLLITVPLTEVKVCCNQISKLLLTPPAF